MGFWKKSHFWNPQSSYSIAVYLVSLGVTGPYPKIAEPLREACFTSLIIVFETLRLAEEAIHRSHLPTDRSPTDCPTQFGNQQLDHLLFEEANLVVAHLSYPMAKQDSLSISNILAPS